MKKQDTSGNMPGEGIFALILLGASLYIFYKAYSLSGFSALASPGAIPMAASGIMVLTMLVVVIKTFMRTLHAARAQASSNAPEDGEEAEAEADDSFEEKEPLAQSRVILPTVLPVFLVMVLGYALLMERIGFFTASFIFLFVAMWFLQHGKVFRALWAAALSLGIVYLIFHYGFDVRLPRGMFF